MSTTVEQNNPARIPVKDQHLFVRGDNLAAIGKFVELYEGETDIEIEAHFGSFDHIGSFNSMVETREFKRILNSLKAKFPMVITQSVDTFYFDDAVRYTTVYDSTGQTTEKFGIVKQRYALLDVFDYNMRVGVSKETKSVLGSDPDPSKLTLTRRKNRATFQIIVGGAVYNLDMTTVNIIKRNDDRSTIKHEIEIEFAGPLCKAHVTNFNTVIGKILREVQNTRIVYTAIEKLRIIRNVSTMLDDKTDKITNGVLTQARNIKYRDLVTGGILPEDDSGLNYRATIKADGLRKLMYIGHDGVFLVQSGNKVMKLMGKNVADLLKPWHDSIFDGEFILPSQFSESATNEERKSIVFYIFDVLAVKGMRSIQTESHTIRMAYAKKFGERISNIPGVIVEPKQFRTIHTAEDFFEINRWLGKSGWPFKTDGIIIVPDGPYDPSARNLPLSQRKLTKIPDTLKFKPAEMLTIDFVVNYSKVVNPGGKRPEYPVLMVDGPKGRTEFVGSIVSPFASKGYVDMQVVGRVPDGTVVEFAFDMETHVFVAENIRVDKDRSNFVFVVQDIWEDIHKPITRGVMEGTEFGLMRRYHNRVKREIFNLSYPEDAQTTPRILLDIGSGRGGDVYKWIDAGFTDIICIEPDLDNIAELEKRLLEAKQDLENKGQQSLNYVIVNTIGQDIEAIKKAVHDYVGDHKVDAISYMLSMSFFFKTSKDMKTIYELTDMINPGGYFLSFNINGKALLKYFKDLGREPVKGWIDSDLTQITLKLSKNEKDVYIDIPNSIVTEQMETVTKLDRVIKHVTENMGFDRMMHMKANKEKLLNPEEVVLSSFYTATVLRRQ